MVQKPPPPVGPENLHWRMGDPGMRPLLPDPGKPQAGATLADWLAVAAFFAAWLFTMYTAALL